MLKEAHEFHELNDEDNDEQAVPKTPQRSRWQRCKAWLCGHPDALGFGFNFISVALFSVVSLLIKLAGAFMGSFELVFCRSAVQLTCGVVWMLLTTHAKLNPFGPFKNRSVMLLLFARATIGIGSMTCWFWALRLLPLSESTLINFLSPVFTAAFGFCILKERISWVEILGMVFSFIGILLVARPSFIFRWFGYYEHGVLSSSLLLSSYSVSSTSTGGLSAEWTRILGVGIGVTGTVFAGLAYVLTRKIGKRVHTSVIVNCLSLAGLVYMPLPIVFLERPIVIPHGTQWLYIVGIGVVAFVAQNFLTLALQAGLAARVVVANYFNIFWAFLWGVLLLGESPAWLSLVGMAFILVNAGIAVFKAFHAKPKAVAITASAEVPYLSVTPRQSVENKHTLEPHEIEMQDVDGGATPADESHIPMLQGSSPESSNPK